jgi:cardiolipin synthase A/B
VTSDADGILRFEMLAAKIGGMPADQIDALSLEIGHSDVPLSEARVQTLLELVPETWRVHVSALIKLWRRGLGPSQPKDLELILRTSGRAYRAATAQEKVELAWTGPTSLQSSFRRTDQVWRDVILEASRTLWIATYATFPGSEVNDAIEEALRKSVQVNLIVERPEDNPNLTVTGINRFSDRIRTESRFWSWAVDRRPGAASGQNSSMHAKCVIADKRMAFVTSANLTDAAMVRNVEVGMLVTGGSLPRRLVECFESMLTVGDLVPFWP